jgi:hypothetical protein
VETPKPCHLVGCYSPTGLAIVTNQTGRITGPGPPGRVLCCLGATCSCLIVLFLLSGVCEPPPPAPPPCRPTTSGAGPGRAARSQAQLQRCHPPPLSRPSPRWCAGLRRRPGASSSRPQRARTAPPGPARLAAACRGSTPRLSPPPRQARLSYLVILYAPVRAFCPTLCARSVLGAEMFVFLVLSWRKYEVCCVKHFLPSRLGILSCRPPVMRQRFCDMWCSVASDQW